jgi:hypothetical protein
MPLLFSNNNGQLKNMANRRKTIMDIAEIIRRWQSGQSIRAIIVGGVFYYPVHQTRVNQKDNIITLKE